MKRTMTEGSLVEMENDNGAACLHGWVHYTGLTISIRTSGGFKGAFSLVLNG